MSRGDLLLQWASCYRELRVARAQTAAERLCAPPVPMDRDDPRMAPYLRAAKRLMRNLVRVGHLEELSAERFRTVPPTLVAQAGGRFLMTGARSERLRERLATAPGTTFLPPTPQHEGPAVWQLAGPQDSVTAAASEFGLTITSDRGADLLASLPCLAETLAGAPLEGLPDKNERWNPYAPLGRTRWSRATGDGHNPGLYRTLRKPHQWYLCPADGTPTIRLNTPERRVAAAWLLLRGNVRLEYSSGERLLSVPAAGFSLPLLVDRGLILASGRLPEWRSRHWCYFEIDPARAHHAARILGVRTEVTP